MSPRPGARRAVAAAQRRTRRSTSERHAEREERRTVGLQVGTGQKGPREIDAKRSALEAEAHAGAAETILHKRVSGPYAHQLLVADVDADAGLGLPGLTPGAVHVGRELHIKCLVERAPRWGTQPQLVLRADRQARWERVGLGLILHLQAEADVAQRDPEAQRAAGTDAELSAEIERVGGAGARGKIAAVAAAIDAELNQLVADAQLERAAQRRGIGREKLEVARRD